MEGITARRALKGNYNEEEIIDQICSVMEVDKADLIQSKNKAQSDTSIYVIKKCTGFTNKEIGGVFRGISSAGVAKAHQRFTEKLKGDKKIKKKTERILSIVRA